MNSSTLYTHTKTKLSTTLSNSQQKSQTRHYFFALSLEHPWSVKFHGSTMSWVVSLFSFTTSSSFFLLALILGFSIRLSSLSLLSLLVFFALASYRVVKIACSCSEVVLQTIKYTMVYPSSGPSLEVIALRQMIWYWRWTVVTVGWTEGSRSLLSEGGNVLVCLVPPA
jgi:hypothetical protein